MRSRPVPSALLALILGTAVNGVARADCESDMIQLEKAMKAPNQTQAVQAAFKEGADKAASAMRKDDDATCHAAVAAALTKAGQTLQ